MLSDIEQLINCLKKGKALFVTARQYAEYFGVPLTSVYYYMQAGKIPAMQIAGRWRIPKEYCLAQLQELIEEFGEMINERERADQ